MRYLQSLRNRTILPLAILACWNGVWAQTLTLQNSGTTQKLHHASFLNPHFGYAAGGTTVLKTTDGGTSWASLNSGNPNYLYFVQFVDANTGWMAGNAGTLLKTTDGGVTWNPQASNTTEILNRGYFLNASTGYVVGYSSTILKTTNGG